MSDIAGLIPPSDLAAEAHVLSAIMTQKSALDDVQDFLRGEHFYSQPNERIYDAIQYASSTGRPLNPAAIEGILKDRGQFDGVGGKQYFRILIEEQPFVLSPRTAGQRVYERARLRGIIAACHAIAAEGYASPTEVQDYFDRAEQTIYSLSRQSVDATTTTMFESIASSFREIESEREGEVDGFNTGLTDLDRFMGPLRLGQLSVIGALSSVGKSALAMNVAPAIARSLVKGERPAVMVFSLEMTHTDLSRRALFTEAEVDSSKVSRFEKIETHEWEKITAAATSVALKNVWLDDRADLQLLEMRAKIRRVQALARKMGHTRMLVVVDYIQLMNGKPGVSKSDTREREVATLAKGLKDMAKECNVHIMALAQLNQDGAKRGDAAKPQMSDLRESKAIAQCADKIVLIHNPLAVERSHKIRNGSDAQSGPLPAEEVELIVAKNRGGMTGSVLAMFKPSITKFINYKRET